MILPTIASISEDSMAAVPQGLREGAYGLGASRMQVAIRVVVPAALSGIVAAIVLGVSRGHRRDDDRADRRGPAAQRGNQPPRGLRDDDDLHRGDRPGRHPDGSTEYKTIFAVGTTLFVLTLAMNMIAIRFVRKYRQVYD